MSEPASENADLLNLPCFIWRPFQAKHEHVSLQLFQALCVACSQTRLFVRLFVRPWLGSLGVEQVPPIRLTGTEGARL